MIHPYLFTCIFIFMCPFLAYAEDIERYEVVDTSLFSSSEGVGGHETFVDHQEIEDYQEIFLKEPLTYTPSVILYSNGPTGRNADFFIRGARSSQNLVLVNDIYVNNPASGGSINLSNFLNADLERIEVLPGPQSLIYGPGALGGVIQLVPKKGQGKPSLKAHAEGGSFFTRYGILTAQGEEGPLQFSGTLAGFGRGPDSFTNPLHGNRESDRYKNGTLSSRIGYALTDNWEVEALIRYAEGKVQFDNPAFSKKENAFLPFKAKNFGEEQTILSSLESKWGNETWEHSLKATYSRILNKTNAPNFHQTTIGEQPVLLYRSSYKINSQNTLLGGFEGGLERAKEPNLHKRSHGGIYLVNTYTPFEETALKGGIRGDYYQSLGTNLTFNVGVDQKVTSSTLLRTSFGTNFKPPVLSDLFQKTPWQVPNPHLKPEKSRSFEIGVDQSLFADKGLVNLTGFINNINKVALSRQLSDGKWLRFNGGRRVVKGLEMAFSLKPIKALEIKVALTLTHARDFPHKTKSPLLPTFKGAGGLYWQALTDLSFFLQGYGVTARKDSANKKRLSPYGIVNIGSSYTITRHASFFWRIENLGNKRYEEVYGYGTRGRAFFVGLEAKTG
ncbi:MAG: TonB-dependent receptor [Alphaproteobacteria bacterium]|nr:TonB-dependent receptor [Alphaproteobacteria bacterium]